MIQEVTSPRSCHSGSSRVCWPGPSLSLPKATPAGVLRTEQYCAFFYGFASVLHFCVFATGFLFYFLISGPLLHLLLLPLFSKCFRLVGPSSSCFCAWFPTYLVGATFSPRITSVMNGDIIKKRKEIRDFMYLEGMHRKRYSPVFARMVSHFCNQ